MQYNHTFEEDAMLFSIVIDAFKKSEKNHTDCFALNATKKFILFDELKTLATNEEFREKYNDLRLKIERYLNSPIEGFEYIKGYYYHSSIVADYCDEVKYQLRK